MSRFAADNPPGNSAPSALKVPSGCPGLKSTPGCVKAPLRHLTVVTALLK
jgi:hypothetical protein